MKPCCPLQARLQARGEPGPARARQSDRRRPRGATAASPPRQTAAGFVEQRGDDAVGLPGAARVEDPLQGHQAGRADQPRPLQHRLQGAVARRGRHQGLN